jgi:hypothetical protein
MICREGFPLPLPLAQGAGEVLFFVYQDHGSCPSLCGAYNFFFKFFFLLDLCGFHSDSPWFVQSHSDSMWIHAE